MSELGQSGLNIIEATVLRLEPGDILLVRVDEELLAEPDAVTSLIEGFRIAIEKAGRTDDVGVLLTADGIGLTVIRPDTSEPDVPGGR